MKEQDKAIENPAESKLRNKTKGAVTAMEFMCECLRRNGIVSVPLADDHAYDAVVDSNRRVFRVQVKTSSLEKNGRTYSCSSRRRVTVYGGGGSTKKSYQVKPYREGELDCIVTKVLGRWYFYATPHLLPNNIRINP